MVEVCVVIRLCELSLKTAYQDGNQQPLPWHSMHSLLHFVLHVCTHTHAHTFFLPYLWVLFTDFIWFWNCNLILPHYMPNFDPYPILNMILVLSQDPGSYLQIPISQFLKLISLCKNVLPWNFGVGTRNSCCYLSGIHILSILCIWSTVQPEDEWLSPRGRLSLGICSTRSQ